MTVLRITMAAGLAVLLAACNNDTGPEPSTQSARMVKLETVSSSALAGSRHFVARVEALNTVDLAFQVGGRIETMPVQEGSVLPRGELAAELESIDYELALRNAEAAHEAAELAHARNERMLPRDAIPRAVWEQSRAELEARQVALYVAQRNLELTRLEAPFDALVTRRLVDPFTQVEPGTPVLRLQDISELRVRASIPEDLMYLLSETGRLRAEAVLSSRPERSFELQYREHSTEPDPVAQTYDISFLLQAPDTTGILPGMTATVRITAIAGMSGSGISVPVAALDTREGDSLRVWVFDEASGTASPRQVEAGSLSGERAQILSGLSDGDRIVAAGAHLLHEDMPVSPMNVR